MQNPNVEARTNAHSHVIEIGVEPTKEGEFPVLVMRVVCGSKEAARILKLGLHDNLRFEALKETPAPLKVPEGFELLGTGDGVTAWVGPAT